MQYKLPNIGCKYSKLVGQNKQEEQLSICEVKHTCLTLKPICRQRVNFVFAFPTELIRVHFYCHFTKWEIIQWRNFISYKVYKVKVTFLYSKVQGPAERYDIFEMTVTRERVLAMVLEWLISSCQEMHSSNNGAFICSISCVYLQQVRWNGSFCGCSHSEWFRNNYNLDHNGRVPSQNTFMKWVNVFPKTGSWRPGTAQGRDRIVREYDKRWKSALFIPLYVKHTLFRCHTDQFAGSYTWKDDVGIFANNIVLITSDEGHFHVSGMVNKLGNGHPKTRNNCIGPYFFREKDEPWL